jgi:plastocyanin
MRPLLTARRVGAALGAAGALAIVLPATAGAATIPVEVGGGNERLLADFQDFFPDPVTVRAGDSVKFLLHGFHTVTFVPRGKRAPGFFGQGPPAPATNDPGGAPYWWGGIPQKTLGQVAGTPTRSTIVTGTRLVNSGLPQGPNANLTASFPRAGTYQYVCLVHHAMRGEVRVLPKDAAAPTAAQMQAKAAAEGRARTAEARAVQAAARRTSPTGSTVLVGAGNRRLNLQSFFPRTLTVKAGTTVTFKLTGKNEYHTVTFGPKAYRDKIEKDFEGSFPLFAPETFYPSEPPNAGVPTLGPTTHGNGFLNSGFMTDPFPGVPGPHSYRVRFTTPGTYNYFCLPHSDSMKGTIKVVA